jgi:perosamine synthetase
MHPNKYLDNLLVDEKATLKKIINVVNENALGACFITSNNKFKAVVTDGDIRNLILHKYSLNKNILKFLKYKKSFTLSYLSSNLNILKKLSKNIKIIPLIDKKTKKIIDYATINKVKKISIYDQKFGGNELKYVSNCLKTGWISSVGNYISLFEKKFSTIFKNKFSLTVSSGTTGLQLALKAIGIKEGDEVIVPNLTFAATANSVIHAGAIPVFADIDKNSYNISPKSIEFKITSKTKAIICVHLYGQPCDMVQIKKIAKKNKLYLVEDCAEALGSKYKRKFISSFGDVSVFSFFGNKTLTTGEGGMLVTSKKEIFLKAKSLRDHGMDTKKKYWHNEVGFNFRMTNLQAAVGLAQLEKIDKIINKKIKIAKIYKKEIEKINKNIDNKIILPASLAGCYNTFWLYNIRIKNFSETDRDKLILRLQEVGVESRNFFYPMSRMKIYKKYLKKFETFPNSDEVYQNGICLPSSPYLKYNEIAYIVRELQKKIAKAP